MIDLAGRRPPEPDLAGTGVLGVQAVGGLSQTLVSGDLAAWSGHAGIEVGRTPAPGRDYAVRVARDRVLAVTSGPLAAGAGWNAAGYATTDVTGGFQVLELSGDALPAILARATTLPGLDMSPSAAIQFAGVPVVAYLMESGRSRLHVDRSLSAYLWSWLRATHRASGLQEAEIVL